MLKTPTGAETLEFGVEWRFVRAGTAKMTHMRRPTGAGWQTDLHVEAGGMVAKLFKVNDDYATIADSQYCTASTFLRAQEGARSRETKVTFDHSKSSYVEHDLVKNAVVQTKELDVPPCVHDVINALYHLRTLRLDSGKNVQLAISDGKKSVSARIEAQERETVKTPLGQFKTIRYEAFLFNEVLYTRKGHLFIWMTDDDRRMPVQIRVRLSVAVGTITLQLEKEASS
jgi:Protein of unknown function (DUF3108)